MPGASNAIYQMAESNAAVSTAKHRNFLSHLGKHNELLVGVKSVSGQVRAKTQNKNESYESCS